MYVNKAPQPNSKQLEIGILYAKTRKETFHCIFYFTYMCMWRGEKKSQNEKFSKKYFISNSNHGLWTATIKQNSCK